jgi:glycosyltransferase involved in cell wall biosynthesis
MPSITIFMASKKKTSIPKILHQLWIGPHPVPSKLLATWEEKHPDFEYILWTEAEIVRRNMIFECQTSINSMIEINGKADIMRWEILYKYGGYFVDADSICIEPFDEYFENITAFATYENENARQGLVATGTMGFVPYHPLCRDIIDWMKTDEFFGMNTQVRAWASVGPALLTKMLDTGKYTDFCVYPSHCFLPIHFTGIVYSGHKKVYAYQAWSSANNVHHDLYNATLPDILKTPKTWVSVYVSSLNTEGQYIKECLDSIKNQTGNFGIEVVWINDGSSERHTVELEEELARFEKQTRFCRVVYRKLNTNHGVAYCCKLGVELCTSEIIFRMDSDDIMFPSRIQDQMKFMFEHPDCAVCGTNLQMFTNPGGDPTKKELLDKRTVHNYQIKWTDFMTKPNNWFMNHPTLCSRKAAVLAVGNYNNNYDRNFYREYIADYELELKLMKKYGAVYNMPDILLYYRIHSDQMSKKTDDPVLQKTQMAVLSDVFNSDNLP